MRLRPLTAPLADADWEHVLSCLAELNERIRELEEPLRAFLREQLGQSWPRILVIETAAGERAGLITLNRFSMPRYAGFGFEIEEIVVLAGFRGKGLGRLAMQALERELRAEPLARKVVVRTNGPDAARLYRSLWQEAEIQTFQCFLNKI
jgi:ribosomal protein S18 acetylase RimI-like enzyme